VLPEPAERMDNGEKRRLLLHSITRSGAWWSARRPRKVCRSMSPMRQSLLGSPRWFELFEASSHRGVHREGCGNAYLVAPSGQITSTGTPRWRA
jgi:hypothetical protein